MYADLHDWASLAAYFEASGYVDYTDNEAETKQQGTSHLCDPLDHTRGSTRL